MSKLFFSEVLMHKMRKLQGLSTALEFLFKQLKYCMYARKKVNHVEMNKRNHYVCVCCLKSYVCLSGKRTVLHLGVCGKFLVEQNSYWCWNILLFLDCC
jgi:hypothetical protein